MTRKTEFLFLHISHKVIDGRRPCGYLDERSAMKHTSGIRVDRLTFVIVILEPRVDGPDEIEKLGT